MKIAVFHDLPSGGGKRALYEQVKRLAKHHEIDVYSLSTADHGFCDLQPYVKNYLVYNFRTSKLFNRPLGRLNQLQRIRDLWKLQTLSKKIAMDVENGDYDLLFAHPCKWTQSPLILNYVRIPSVYYCHEYNRIIYDSRNIIGRVNSRLRLFLDYIDPLKFIYFSTLKAMDCMAIRSANIVLVNSKFSQRNVERIYNVVSRVNYLGVDLEIFHPLKDKSKKTYILSVGAIQPNKGFDDVINLVGSISPKLRPPLKIIGNFEVPGERDRLLALADQKGVSLQIEVGISVEELVNAYNHALFLLYLPYKEPFGLVVLESMACGTPVIGVNEGGICETILDGETGYLTHRRGIDAVNKIEKMLTDIHLQKQMGERAQEIVKKYWSWNRSIEALESEFSRILSPNSNVV